MTEERRGILGSDVPGNSNTELQQLTAILLLMEVSGTAAADELCLSSFSEDLFGPEKLSSTALFCNLFLYPHTLWNVHDFTTGSNGTVNH